MKLVIDPENLNAAAMLVSQLKQLPLDKDLRQLTVAEAQDALKGVAEYAGTVLFEETREVTTDYDPATNGYEGHHQERWVSVWEDA